MEMWKWAFCRRARFSALLCRVNVWRRKGKQTRPSCHQLTLGSVPAHTHTHAHTHARSKTHTHTHTHSYQHTHTPPVAIFELLIQRLCSNDFMVCHKMHSSSIIFPLLEGRVCYVCVCVCVCVC